MEFAGTLQLCLSVALSSFHPLDYFSRNPPFNPFLPAGVKIRAICTCQLSSTQATMQLVETKALDSGASGFVSPTMRRILRTDETVGRSSWKKRMWLLRRQPESILLLSLLFNSLRTERKISLRAFKPDMSFADVTGSPAPKTRSGV